MRRRFLLPAFCLLALAACSAAPALPGGHVVGPDEAQAILYDATVTARAASTQSAGATATRVREQEQVADDLTRTAAQAQAVATELAATPTALAYSLAIGAATERASAHATQAVITAQATARGDLLKSAFGILGICLFAVIIYCLYWFGRVAIARMMFRDLQGGVVAEFNPRTGWDTWQTRQPPALLSSPVTQETRAEQARRAWLAENDINWTRFYRRLVLWAQYAGSWSNSRLCDELDALSDDAWRTATEELSKAGILIRTGGRNKRETVWHPDWNYSRFEEKGMAALLPHSPTEPPPIKVPPPYHNTTVPQSTQRTTADQIILYQE